MGARPCDLIDSVSLNKLEDKFPYVFPSCAVTRSQAKQKADKDEIDLDVSLGDTFMNQDVVSDDKLSVNQRGDPELDRLFDISVSEEDSKGVARCYFVKSGILMRKWRPVDVPADQEWHVVYQVVVPRKYRPQLIQIAHESGHVGINKTTYRILRHFYWPRVRKDVAQFCKTCHTCQKVGKPNQTIPVAPLKPIPVFDEPFSKVLVDCVGPLPRTKSGQNYLLTIMCTSTRFPEAFPLRAITAPAIVKALIKFFTTFGLPKEIQSDKGSQFVSNIFIQVMDQLGVDQFVSSAYHPESQGALERYHQTLKTMIKCYCEDHDRDWDVGIPLLLFATR